MGAVAPDFSLPGVDGKNYSLQSFSGKSIVVIIFSCNHCPYVQAYEDRMIALQRQYQDKGVSFVAINANETVNYPGDTFDKMVVRAKEKGFNFPYLRDDSQKVADAFGAHYTPEIFLLDGERRLRYTGKIDDNWQDPSQVKTSHLRDALDATLAGKPIDTPETHAIGCTIKWAK
jgi:peroxiredoxin